MDKSEERTILINASVAVLNITELKIKEKIFNDIIKANGIDRIYYFRPERNLWSIKL